jgi:hypothetical protein
MSGRILIGHVRMFASLDKNAFPEIGIFNNHEKKGGKNVTGKTW